MTKRVGIRELNQHASRVVADVKLGQTVIVTERGVPVARLVPYREETWEDLIARGAVEPARGSMNDYIKKLLSQPAKPRTGPSLAEILEEDRAAHEW